jgi:hypothetical protein
LQPILEMNFANLSVREKLGTTVVLKSNVIEIPPLQEIPPYGPEPRVLYGIPLDVNDSYRNRNYYRDLAIYVRDRSLQCPIGAAVTNVSPIVAEEVLVTLELNIAPDFVVLDENDTPVKPSKWIGSFRPANKDQRVHVGRYGDNYEVRCQMGTVQPRTTQWSQEPFYIGARNPMTVSARIQMAANNLPTPITLDAQIEIQVNRRPISEDDFRKAQKA